MKNLMNLKQFEIANQETVIGGRISGIRSLFNANQPTNASEAFAVISGSAEFASLGLNAAETSLLQSRIEGAYNRTFGFLSRVNHPLTDLGSFSSAVRVFNLLTR